MRPLAPVHLMAAAGVLALAAALVWRGPGLAGQVAVLEARQALAANQLEVARSKGLEALRSDPAGAEPLMTLGDVAAAQGDTTAALRLHQEAAARSQRALDSHVWLARELGQRGDVEGALHHVDILLRSHVNLRDALYPALVGLAQSPAGARALADRLAQAPSWRASFLSHMAREAESAQPQLALHAHLQHTEAPPTLVEQRALLHRLVRDGQYRAAWMQFVAGLDATGLAQLGNVYNGGFELEATGLPFDWQIGRPAGARIQQLESVDDDGGRSTRLYIEFANRRVAFNHVSQLLMLGPGEYRLHGRVRLEALTNARGLEWFVQCASTPRTVLGRSERISGTRAWGGFQADFTVPEEGCQAQWLRLHIPARIDAERQISGRAWFDDIRIQRLSAGQ